MTNWEEEWVYFLKRKSSWKHLKGFGFILLRSLRTWFLMKQGDKPRGKEKLFELPGSASLTSCLLNAMCNVKTLFFSLSRSLSLLAYAVGTDNAHSWAQRTPSSPRWAGIWTHCLKEVLATKHRDWQDQHLSHWRKVKRRSDGRPTDEGLQLSVAGVASSFPVPRGSRGF